jgi:hypothetical protein
LINFCTRFHLYVHIYALVLQQRGITLLQVSSIESVVIGTLFLAEVPTGVIADRIGRKWSIVVSTFLLMCGELIFLFARSYPAYLVLAVFTGTGFAFASGAVESLIYDSLPTENQNNLMKRAMGRYGSIGQIAFFIAPIIGGLIIGSDLMPERFNIAIVLTILALFIGVLISLTLREPPSPWEAERPASLTILRHGLGDLRASRQLRRIILLTVFTSTFTGTLVTTFAATHLTRNDVPPLFIGLALSFGSLLAAFTQRYAYRVEQVLGSRWGITALTLLPGGLYLLLALITGPASWLIITLMYGVNEMKMPLFSAYQNAHISSGSRATALSLISMFSSLFVAVMAPVYAALATYSIPLAFLAIGTVIVVAAIALRIDRLGMGVAVKNESSTEAPS